MLIQIMSEFLIIQQQILTMGNKPQEKIKTGLADQDTLVKEYTPPFERHRDDPTFFVNLIHESPRFIKNLLELFPDAKLKFENFFEMVLFLRREEAKFNVNKFAAENAHKSNLLDRFFMILLKVDYETYRHKEVTLDELDELVVEYMRFFLPEPEKGSAAKMLQFMRIEGDKFNLRDFSLSFREYFFQVQRYLKDFYLLKFNKMEKNAHLLRQFNSKIIHNDAVLLALKIPRLTNPQIVSLYDTEKYGLGFHSLEKQLVGYTGPWMMLVHHYEKNQEGYKEYYVFGAYQNGPIRNVLSFQGDVTGMMFSIHPKIKFFTTDKGDGEGHYFYINSIPEEKSKMRKGFGFGGTKYHDNFKLWIDEDLDRSTVNNGKDKTYGYGALASPGTEKLHIKRLEVWGLGSRYNYEEQMQYWQDREDEAMKRRKVDKKELLGQNAEMFFEKTFQHRGEVVGQIERHPRKEEEQS